MHLENVCLSCEPKSVDQIFLVRFCQFVTDFLDVQEEFIFVIEAVDLLVHILVHQLGGVGGKVWALLKSLDSVVESLDLSCLCLFDYFFSLSWPLFGIDPFFHMSVQFY